jgi:hypothetical protein
MTSCWPSPPHAAPDRLHDGGRGRRPAPRDRQRGHQVFRRRFPRFHPDRGLGPDHVARRVPDQQGRDAGDPRAASPRSCSRCSARSAPATAITCTPISPAPARSAAGSSRRAGYRRAEFRARDRCRGGARTRRNDGRARLPGRAGGRCVRLGGDRRCAEAPPLSLPRGAAEVAWRSRHRYLRTPRRTRPAPRCARWPPRGVRGRYPPAMRGPRPPGRRRRYRAGRRRAATRHDAPAAVTASTAPVERSPAALRPARGPLEQRVRASATRQTPGRVTQPGNAGRSAAIPGLSGDRLEPITGRSAAAASPSRCACALSTASR